MAIKIVNDKIVKQINDSLIEFKKKILTQKRFLKMKIQIK